MQRELQKQQLDFSLLMDQPEVNEEVLKSLTNFNDGRSNIDISAYGY